jgi:hypothetical protein
MIPVIGAAVFWRHSWKPQCPDQGLISTVSLTGTGDGVQECADYRVGLGASPHVTPSHHVVCAFRRRLYSHVQIVFSYS